MKHKVVRDPLYNYVAIDLDRHHWLLDLLDTPELQRLRRIHQLGISHLTYPGADHSRLSHCLGVLHLMGLAFQHLDREYRDEQVHQARAPLLAAALLHDVGHGPFSHVFEPCLGVDHEDWSIRAILDEDTDINKVLRRVHKTLPQTVADLVDPNNNDHPRWQKYLLSSQLDMDRLDYLRRDSLFSGAGYGHFDWYRILTSFELYDGGDANRDLVWPDKSKLAIEEYVFARYYMYQNVYFHKTTRGFEKLLVALWKRARQLHDSGRAISLLPAIRRLWAKDPAVVDYVRVEEFTVLQQLEQWTRSRDPGLAELSDRFLRRKRFAMVEPPENIREIAGGIRDWERQLKRLVRQRGHTPVELYCLRDELKSKYMQPYLPEKELDEQSIKNAIRVRVDGASEPIEISEVLDRLKPVTKRQENRYRYYIPKDVQDAALKLREGWN